jgi:hypothetical protein
VEDVLEPVKYKFSATEPAILFFQSIPNQSLYFSQNYILNQQKMKFPSALLVLSAFGNIAFAAPVTDGQLQAANQSPSPAGIAQAHLEKRALNCQSIARTIWIGHGILETAYVLT